MKVHVNICSRSRPLGMVGVVMSLWRLRSGRHDLRFNLGLDDDDENSIIAAQNLADEAPIAIHTAPRPVARGEIENRVLDQSRDADIVTMLTDRTFCITPGWDDALAKGVTEEPKRLLWWTCPEDPVCVMPVISRPWLDACDYRWSPEIFPFWFDDTWNQQIDLMLYGLPSLKILTTYSGVRAATNRAREFEFWINVFRNTLPQRVEQAERMAERLGTPYIDRPEAFEYFERHYNTLMGNCPRLYEMFGDQGEPGPGYAIARANAEQYHPATQVAAE